MPANPEPISKPLLALIASIAFARSLSSLSKTGSPSPGGTPRTEHSTTPPRESRASRVRSISSTMRAAASGSGQRTGVFSTSARVTVSGSTSASMSLVRLTYAVHSTPKRSPRNRRATAPAATWPTVTRAEERPPPLGSRIPYFASKV